MSELRNTEVVGWWVWRDDSLTHLAGATPGTPYTRCGLDAGGMIRAFHAVDHAAAAWCVDCLTTGLS
jgi:hypothetical protein